MPLRSLRPGRCSERDQLQRRSTLDPGTLFTKRADKAAHLDPARAAVSVDGGRPRGADVARPSTSRHEQQQQQQQHDQGRRGSSPAVQEATPDTRRFSVMRFRHASDTQLSTKAKEQAARDAPPVPPVPINPQPAPAIITTAPTVVDAEGQQDMSAATTPTTPTTPTAAAAPKRSRLQQLGLRRRSFDPSTAQRPNSLRKSMDKRRKPQQQKSHGNLLEGNGHPPATTAPGQPPSPPEAAANPPPNST